MTTKNEAKQDICNALTASDIGLNTLHTQCVGCKYHEDYDVSTCVSVKCATHTLHVVLCRMKAALWSAQSYILDQPDEPTNTPMQTGSVEWLELLAHHLNNTQVSLQELEHRVDSINQDVTDIQEQIDAVGEESYSTQVSVESLENSHMALAQRVTRVEEQVANLTADAGYPTCGDCELNAFKCHQPTSQEACGMFVEKESNYD